MNCSEAKELIQLYLDEELSCRDTLEVQRHLESCPSCTALLDYFARQDDTLKKFARSETLNNSQLRGRILQAINEEKLLPSVGRWRSFISNPLLRRVAAILVFAAIIAFFVLRGSTPLINEKVYADAILDHADHCTLDRLKRAISDTEQLDKMVATYSKLAKTPDLSAFGYQEPRGKICKLDGAKLFHVVYQKENDKPLSIFIKLHDTRLVARELVSITRADYRLTSLSEKGTDLVMVSTLDEMQAAAVARAIVSQMQE